MLVEIYYEIDEFCKKHSENIEKWLKESGTLKKASNCSLSISEIMTILVYNHLSHYRTFKNYYNEHVLRDLKRDFKRLPSYNRFVELLPRAFFPLFLFLKERFTKSKATGVYYIDSTPVPACHPKRVHYHKVMRPFASWGKTSVGWFFGLKIHLIINNLGELMDFAITDGSTADNDLVTLHQMTKNLLGWLFGDKGYLLSEEKREFIENGGNLKVFTKSRKNMKKGNCSMPVEARLWLAKRGMIESAIDLMKNACEVSHTRHRSSKNAFCCMIAGLCAYSFFQRKPRAKINLESRLIECPKSADREAA